MSQTGASSIKQLKYDAGAARVDMKLEVALIPVSDRLPGRIDPATTTFASANDLASAMRRQDQTPLRFFGWTTALPFIILARSDKTCFNSRHKIGPGGQS